MNPDYKPNLFPAAQTVLDAVSNSSAQSDGYRYTTNSLKAAAALRAAANVVAPEAMPHRRKIRAELLSIAVELEAQ